MFIPPPLTVADRFVLALEGLYRAVAARRRISVLAGRGTEVLAETLIILICTRIRRVEGRISRMLARFQAGKLRVWATERAGDGGGVPLAPVTRVIRAENRLPRTFAWLLPLVPSDAAGFAAHLRMVLAEPEMVGLLAAAPQAARVLAPVCRMLGIEAAVLAPRVEGSAEAVVAPVGTVVKARVRKAKVPVDWGRIPLPRGVLSAARRQGFGKV